MKLTGLYFLLIISFFCFRTGHAQDLIVTIENDSLNTEITKTDNENVYYKYITEDGLIQSSSLPMSYIEVIIRDYYRESTETEYQYVEESELGGSEIIRPKKKRVAIRGFGGWALRIGVIPDNDLGDYYNKLKSGYNFGGDMSFFFTDKLGFGFHINMFKSSEGPISVTKTSPNSPQLFGTLQDEIEIGFYSPVFVVRFEGSDPGDRIYLQGGLGFTTWSQYTLFLEQLTGERESYLFEGNTLGLYVAARYELDMTENIGLNFGVDLHTASILIYDVTFEDGSKMRVDATSSGEGEGLLRFSINGGIAFKF